MKKLVLSFFALLIIGFCFAQKVDLDRFYVHVSYRNLPAKPLGFDFKTFQVQATFSSVIAKLFTAEEVIPNFAIEGFKRVEEKGDILVKFELKDFQIQKTEVKNRVDEEKDKTGKVISRTTSYWFEIDYALAADYEIVNNKTNLSLSKASLEEFNASHNFKSAEYKTYNAARDFYILNKEGVQRDLISSRLKEYYAEMNNSLTNMYGYRVVSENELVWISGAKKHPETAPYMTNFNIMKDAFSLMTSDAPVDQIKEKLQPAIEYLNGLPKKYTADEKADRKMRYSAYYNLGKIYLYLDMPDEAIVQGNAIITNDYDTGDGKRLIEQANKLKGSFKLNNTSSRHFERNFSDIL